METRLSSPKFAFYYLLSLVALVFTAISVGQIIFQFINRHLPDIFGQYGTDFSSDVLKFAISAIVIATPIFFWITKLIYRNLFTGKLDKDSGIRRWLTYFILFVSAVVIIVFLIITINNFLNGEWTSKFLLKMLTVIALAAMVFTFYLHDIRRTEVVGQKDRTTRIYFFAALVIVIAAFVTSLFMVESPQAARNRRVDERIISNFYNIESGVNSYYLEHKELPASLDQIQTNYLSSESLRDPSTQEPFTYKVSSSTVFQLCANFRTDTKNTKDVAYQYLPDTQRHLTGYQCLDFKIYPDNIKGGAVEMKY